MSRMCETASSKEVHQTSSACKSGPAASCRNSLHCQKVPPNYLWTTLELLFCLHPEGSSASTSQSKKSEGTTEFQKKIALAVSRQVLAASISGNANCEVHRPLAVQLSAQDLLANLGTSWAPKNEVFQVLQTWVSSWWLNQPIWKIWVKMGIFPNFRGEHKKYLSCHHL